MASDARMALVSEPVFCATGISALWQNCPSRGPAAVSQDVSGLNHDEEDEGEDEDGGVSLSASDSPPAAPVLSSAPETSSSSGLAPAILFALSGHTWTGDQRHLYQVPSVLGSSHPRPETPESLYEENGRRLRFALDGTDVDDDAEFATDAVTTVERNAAVDEHLPNDTDALNQPEGTSSLHAIPAPHNARPAVHSVHAVEDSHSEAIAIPFFPTHDPTSDEWLAVDDPHWGYDFAAFLDNWRLTSITDRRLATFEPKLKPSITQWRPPDEITSFDITLFDDDLQGIPWSRIGASRDEALAVRKILHPGYHSRCHDPPAGPVAPSSHAGYGFRNFVTHHRPSYEHYQLRNVLAAPSRSHVYYAANNPANNTTQVRHTSLACPTASTTVFDTSIRITCLAATTSTYISTEPTLLAGGFDGEYALLPPNSVSPILGTVTHAYNGLVTHVSSSTIRSPSAAFTSNDHHLRVLDLTTNTFVHTSPAYASALNCSALSPDTRLRSLVGDCCDVLITSAASGEILVTLEGHSDHGFACAWSPSAPLLATGAEDGKTIVWDARNWSRPLQTLASVMGAPRSVHFTECGDLIVAEAEDVVGIYDGSREFEKVQEVRLFGSLAGLAVLDGGEELVVAVADEKVGGLATFSRSGGLRGGRHRDRQGMRPMTSTLLGI